MECFLKEIYTRKYVSHTFQYYFFELNSLNDIIDVTNQRCGSRTAIYEMIP